MVIYVRLPSVDIDKNDMREMSRLIIPIFFVLVMQSIFDEWFSVLSEEAKFLVILGLVIGMAFAYSSALKRWAR